MIPSTLTCAAEFSIAPPIIRANDVRILGVAKRSIATFQYLYLMLDRRLEKGWEYGRINKAEYYTLLQDPKDACLSNQDLSRLLHTSNLSIQCKAPMKY